jgi:hypothetical protein
MSDVLPNTSQEFWHPPSLAQSDSAITAFRVSELARSCGICGTEFMAGSGFCYVCGATRGAQPRAPLASSKTRFGFFRILGFQSIKQGLGLSVPSLIGFIAGVACLTAAAGLGHVFPVQTANDYQALQLLRIEWLLGSVAAFVAGLLLRNAGGHK